jgi:hypothetical protein
MRLIDDSNAGDSGVDIVASPLGKRSPTPFLLDRLPTPVNARRPPHIKTFY